MTHAELQRTMQTFLAAVPTLTLATVDDAGEPHACNLNFVADDAMHLYWISHPDSAHSRHLTARSNVAVAAYAPFNEPSEIRGVQIHGLAAPISFAARDKVLRIFFDKFPYAVHLESRIAREQFYQLTPTWVRWVDNSVSFGFKIESEWPMSM